MIRRPPRSTRTTHSFPPRSSSDRSVKPETYTPKLLTVFREGYSAATFRADAIAGLTVAIVALPLAMALGIASGASPDKGLITAVVAGFLISALRSEEHTSELQSLMRISYAVFCLKKKITTK